MGQHDSYGKMLMANVVGQRWSADSYSRSIALEGIRADLDGVIRTADLKTVHWAVEIETRLAKQLRGTVVDLALHPALNKLLILIEMPPQLPDAAKAARHLRYVWQRLISTGFGRFEIIVLPGIWSPDREKQHEIILRKELTTLGILSDVKQ
jgi:hypothetical protein